jgi:hypothetical protein
VTVTSARGPVTAGTDTLVAGSALVDVMNTGKLPVIGGAGSRSPVLVETTATPPTASLVPEGSKRTVEGEP